MKILEVIRVVNQMVADGVIERYAIGGAVGATFYLEPVSTLDVDIFLERQSPGKIQTEGEHSVRGRRWVDCIGKCDTSILMLP